MLHALVLRLFYSYPLDSCLDVEVKSIGFPVQPAGLAETPAATSLDERHRRCQALLPKQSEELWDALVALGEDSLRCSPIAGDSSHPIFHCKAAI